MENNQLLPFERNRYYVGKLLTSADFQAEQAYNNHKRRFLNEMMFGSANDVVVCRDRLSASGTLYTLLALHDRECARKMLTVMENGRQTGGPPVCCVFLRTKRCCSCSPITLSAKDRGIGGLGIFMVKSTMDDVRYQYENGQNVLTICKKL